MKKNLFAQNLNFVTPSNSLLIKSLGLLVCVLCLAFQSSYCQSTSLEIPREDSIRAEIKRQYNTILSHDLKLIKDGGKYEYLQLIPLPSWNANFGFGLSFNLMSVFGFVLSKRKRKLLERRTIEKAQTDYEQTLNSALIDLELIRLEAYNLNINDSLERAIFSIKLEAYKDLAITPEQFYNEKIKVRNLDLAKQNRLLDIKRKVLEFKKKYNIKTFSFDTVYFDAYENECILNSSVVFANNKYNDNIYGIIKQVKTWERRQGLF